jgi:hypothetical protein
MDFESPQVSGSKMGSIYKAWFQPPVTARYRFYMVCDDKCEMKMATCPAKNDPTTTLLT